MLRMQKQKAFGREIQVITPHDTSRRREVYKLWHHIYCKEMKRYQDFRVLSYHFMKDVLEPHSHIITANIDGKIIGTLRINFPEESELTSYHSFYELDNFSPYSVGIGTRYMVHPDYRGLSLSKDMMLKSFDLLKLYGKKHFIIDCNKAVYGLFQKFGFKDYLGEKMSKDFGKVRIMKYEIK